MLISTMAKFLAIGANFTAHQARVKHYLRRLAVVKCPEAVRFNQGQLRFYQFLANHAKAQQLHLLATA